jgi:hypothetical protein
MTGFWYSSVVHAVIGGVYSSAAGFVNLLILPGK